MPRPSFSGLVSSDVQEGPVSTGFQFQPSGAFSEQLIREREEAALRHLERDWSTISTIPLTSSIAEEILGDSPQPTDGDPEGGTFNIPAATAARTRRFTLNMKPMKKTTAENRRSVPLRELFRFQPPVILPFAHHEDVLIRHGLDKYTAYKYEDERSMVGIEVEVENVRRIDPNLTLTWWVVEEDHSLRNNGREFKTCPLPLRYAQAALTQLFAGINADCDFSHRTSVHVHQDVRGMTVENLTVLILTYMIVEPLLFKFADISRRRSIYCVPLNASNNLQKLVNSGDITAVVRYATESWDKYNAFNLLPVSKFGTVEYRHMSGTNNIQKILLWLDLIAHLKVWAYKTPLDKMMSHIAQLNTSSAYREFVASIFGEALCGALDMARLRYDLESGVYHAKHAAFTNTFHNTIINVKPLQDSSLWLAYHKPVKLSAEQRDAWEIMAENSRWLSQVIREGSQDLNELIRDMRKREESYASMFSNEATGKVSRKLVLDAFAILCRD